jgi:hypothetical protein
MTEDHVETENPPQFHVFPDKARPDYTPFSPSQTQKFVHISPERLQQWATANSINVDPNDLKNGLVLIGHSTMNHRDLLINNLNLSRDPKDRSQINQFGCFNTGFIVQIDDHACTLAESSGDLTDEAGRDFFARSEDEMVTLHRQTADKLNKIYQGIINFSVFGQEE